MKLILLAANYPYGKGGDNNFIQNEIFALAKKFDKVTVISTGEGELRTDVPDNVKVIKCKINKIKLKELLEASTFLIKKSAWSAYRELIRFYPRTSLFEALKQIFKYEYAYYCMKNFLIEECKDADLVYSYWMSSRAFAMAKLIHKNVYSKAFISRVHGFDCYLLDESKLPYRDYIVGTLNKIICVSNAGEKYYRQNILPHLTNKCKLETRYLGVNKDSETQNISKKKKDVLQIATCSSIINVKRLDILVEALSQINSICIEWTHFGDGNLKREIESVAKEKLGNKENISYVFKGSVDNKTLLEYYRNSYFDLFVNCSDSEGIPVSIMEAYSFGIPAMARNVGGNCEIVIDDTGDYLIDGKAAPNILAEKIINYANKTEEEKKMRRIAVTKIFNDKFSGKAIEEFARDIYELAKGDNK